MEENKINKILMPVEAIKTREFLIKFLQDTKDWNKLLIEKEYEVVAKSTEDVVKLVNNLRVSISRVRNMYRVNNKSVPPFRFTSRIEKTSEPNENGYATYKLILGKANSTSSVNKQLIEELL